MTCMFMIQEGCVRYVNNPTSIRMGPAAVLAVRSRVAAQQLFVSYIVYHALEPRSRKDLRESSLFRFFLFLCMHVDVRACRWRPRCADGPALPNARGSAARS
jgi:hypothetical protein